MYVGITIALIYWSLIQHEFGHLTAARNRGVAVSEFGIGLPFGPHIGYTPTRGTYSGIRFSLYVFTFFLGAFVRMDDNSLKALSYQDKAVIAMSGPLANIQIGCLLLL